jgi:dolichol kinase
LTLADVVLTLLELIVSTITLIIIGVMFFFFWLFYKRIQPLMHGEGLVEIFKELSASVSKDYSSEEGGIASAAKRGEKAFLYEMARGVMNHYSGGLYELFVEGISSITGERFDFDGWLKGNPYAGIRVIMNPQVQQMLQRFDVTALAQRFAQSQQGGTATHGKAW